MIIKANVIKLTVRDATLLLGLSVIGGVLQAVRMASK